MKKKLLALFLSICLALTAIPMTAVAQTPDDAQSGMVIQKRVEEIEGKNDEFKIILDAFSTGDQIVETVVTEKPTDIILVLDQSGSMTDPFNTTSYTYTEYSTKTNEYLYSQRANGGDNNLWYLASDGKPYSVSVQKTGQFSYEKLQPASYRNNDNNWGYATNLRDNRDNLYVKKGDVYYKVSVSREWKNNLADYRYTYKYDNKTTRSDRYTGSPSLENGYDGFYKQIENNENAVYSYYYVDVNTSTTPILIGTYTGSNGSVADTFYKRTETTTSTTRLNALKEAVSLFANNVAEKAQKYNVDHRIAIVGFATGDYTRNSDYPIYENTEVFIGSNTYGYTTVTADNGSVYSRAFQNMNTQSGRTNITNSINSLAARGATAVDDGLTMAAGILDNDPYKIGDDHKKEDRNKVVIVFTDGEPNHWSGYSDDVANAAINTSKSLKQDGITVYTVGILTNITDINEFDATTNNIGKINKYMHGVSSNYPDATSISKLGTKNPNVTNDSGYYLLAANGADLNNIFENISNNIDRDSSVAEIGSTTVVKDLVSPQFTLPGGAEVSSITVERVAFAGFDSDGNYTWNETSRTPVPSSEIQVAVVAAEDTTGNAPENNGSVSVTGYDFSDNWCGNDTFNGVDTPHGAKLVISFNVKVRNGFLGGNVVDTNAAATVEIHDKNGNYVDTIEFEKPAVNVAINNVAVDPEDKNVYLYGDVTKDDMIDGATVTVGNVPLYLTKPYDASTGKIYDLETWQTDYVDITVEYKDKDGNVIYRELNGQKDQHSGESFVASPVSSDYTVDDDFTISVVVAPKEEYDDELPGAEAVTKSADGKGKVNVFKPEVTFTDENVYLGAQYPTLADKDPASVVWKHGDTTAPAAMGTAPELNYTYTVAKPEGAAVINTSDDIPVTVVTNMGNININEYTTYQHTVDAFDDDNFGTDAQLKLHVFTPTMTYKDANVYLGGSYPNFNNGDTNILVSTVWKKGDTVAPEAMGAAPTLAATYETKNEQITSKDDVEMNVTSVKANDVEISSNVTFAHNACGSPKLNPECNTSLTTHTGLNGTEFKLHVFTPEMTFTDLTKYYGEEFSMSTANFKTGTTTWKNGEAASTGKTMSNAEPTLTTTYAVTTADAAKIANGEINTPDGKIGVEATVKAGSVDLTALTKFNHSHEGCDAPIESHMGDAASNEAWIHVENCQLTVKKVGGNTGDTYVIYVMKDDVKYTEMVLNGDSEATIYRLPVGSYTIQEDTKWSWRFTPSYSGTANLTGAANHEGTLTCTNTKNNNKNQWLDGFSAIVTNIKSK